MKTIIYSILFSLLFVSVKSYGQSPYPANTSLADVIGITHMNGKYRFDPSKDFMKEGVDEIEAMGTKVIKLFMGRSTAVAYPRYWGTNWPNLTTNTFTLTDLAQTPYFQDALNRTQFKTYVLTTNELTNNGNVTYFQDGISPEEETRLYQEIYNFTTYLCNTFENTGKTFILSNWEGDGMLGFVNESPNLPSVTVQNTRINGFIKWFQIRQRAITDARNAANKQGVSVLGAAEFNHVNKGQTYTWPTMIDRVVPYLNMDLYSFSNWKSNTPSTVDDFNDLIKYITDRCPSSTLFGRNNLYLGETGTFEYLNVVGYINGSTAASDRVSREIMQRNTEMALKAGIRFIVHWAIFDNGVRSGVTITPEDRNATESEGMGVGIRRANGSYSGTYTYYKSIMSKTIGEYLNVYEAEAQVTSKSSTTTEGDVLLGDASGSYLSKLEANATNNWIQYALRVSQTGECNVKAIIRKGPTYGKFRLSIGSQTINTEIDCYSPTGSFELVDLGNFTFGANPATYNFRFNVTDKNSAATEYDLGFDAIILSPTSKQDPILANFANLTKLDNDAAFNLIAPTSNSDGAFTYTSSNTNVATVNGNQVTITGIGTTEITATQAATTQYNAGEIKLILTVNSSVPVPPRQVVSIASGNWLDANTWANGNIPLETDEVTISSGHTVTQNVESIGGVNIAKLSIEGTLQFSDLAQELKIKGNLAIGTQGRLNSFGLSNNIGKNVLLGGNLVNNGNVDFSKNPSSGNSLTLNGTSLQEISGGGSFGNIQSLALNNPAGATLSTPLSIIRALRLLAGELNNQSSLTLNQFSGITTIAVEITAPAKLLGNQVVRGGTANINITYRGSVQAIAGSEIPSALISTNNVTSKTINTLTIDNSAGLILNDDIILTSASIPLVFTRGIIKLGPTNTLTCNNLPAAGSATSFIEGGTLILRVRNDNTAAVNFPIGSGGQYRRITFNDMKAVSAPATFVGLNITAAEGGTVGTGVTSLSSKRRWVTRITSGPNATYKNVSILYGTDDGGNDIDVIANATSIDGTYQALNVNAPASSVISTSNSSDWTLSTSSIYFALGNKNLDVLPVTLASFAAEGLSNGIKLHWRTLSETSNKVYVVQRSQNGLDFSDLLTIDAKNEAASYVAFDPKPLNGMNYYRLVQYDVDGTYKELAITYANFILQAPDLRVYPNPVENVLSIQSTEFDSGMVNLRIFSISGKQLLAQSISADSLINGYSLDMSNGFESGIYLLSISNGNITRQVKIIKK
ncbi:T9SS type A sorting domain-containing protein [Pedobacter glucosidilyticus]|uniref:T9SS type A sorting domain-containing protein n=1 Tax=Pedobacter glucosidilyticus TaxID=1122941 RepID=UPI0026EB8B86|nr:T9SS type A sorting domain-containing protein [Pedobacter glucosidilyticus]